MQLSNKIVETTSLVRDLYLINLNLSDMKTNYTIWLEKWFLNNGFS